MQNIALLMQVLLPLLDRATAITALLNLAQKEGRDITDSELNAAFAEDDIAREKTDAAIRSVRAA